jgi:hypothetical protein
LTAHAACQLNPEAKKPTQTTHKERIMANFPRPEAEIKVLAQNIITGLTGNPNFPSPPVTPAALQTLLTNFITLGDAQIAAQAAAQQATEAKRAALNELVAAMKSVLRYAENTVGGNAAKLAALGWGGKSAPTALQIPGQPRSLEAPRQGEGWLFLDWKTPTDGGAVSFYKIERRMLPGGTWEVAGMAIEPEAKLANQERGKEWEYQVIAINKAGESWPSNAVAAVL